MHFQFLLISLTVPSKTYLTSVPLPLLKNLDGKNFSFSDFYLQSRSFNTGAIAFLEISLLGPGPCFWQRLGITTISE